MTDEATRVEIGIGIGQVLSVKLTEKELGALRKAVESGDGWHDMKSTEGSVAINVATVVFLRIDDASHSIGFSS